MKQTLGTQPVLLDGLWKTWLHLLLPNISPNIRVDTLKSPQLGPLRQGHQDPWGRVDPLRPRAELAFRLLAPSPGPLKGLVSQPPVFGTSARVEWTWRQRAACVLVAGFQVL